METQDFIDEFLLRKADTEYSLLDFILEANPEDYDDIGLRESIQDIQKAFKQHIRAKLDYVEEIVLSKENIDGPDWE